MEAEVSEPVLPANCKILPAPGVKAAVAPNLPRLEATNVNKPAVSTNTVVPRTIGPPTQAELDLLSTSKSPVASIKQPASEPINTQSGTKLPPAAATHTISANPCPSSCSSHPRTPWNKLNNNPKMVLTRLRKRNLRMPKHILLC